MSTSKFLADQSFVFVRRRSYCGERRLCGFFYVPSGGKKYTKVVDDLPLFETEDPPLIETEDPLLFETEDPPLFETEDPPLFEAEDPPLFETDGLL